MALVHHYAGLAIPSSLLADALKVPNTAYVDLRVRMSPETLTLLVEDLDGEWRTTHDLIAAEILAQLSTPPSTDAPAGPDAWHMALSTLAIRLIDQASSEFGDALPDDVSALIDQMFIARHSRSLLAADDRETFARSCETYRRWPAG